MAEKSPPKAPFVDKIVAGADTPPRVRLLTGYVGDSCEKNCVRLYADAELTSYVEIPAVVVRHSEPVEGDALGAVHLWVDRDAEVISRGENVIERRGRFLDGPLARGTAARDPLQPEPPGPGGIRALQSLVDGCPSRLFDVCDFTTQVACPPTRLICPTERPRCLEITDIGCPVPSVDSPCDFRTRIPAACGVRTLNPRECFVRTLLDAECGVIRTRNPLECGGASLVDGCPSERQICQTENAFACGGPNTFQGGGCGGGRSLVDGCRSTPGGCFDGGGFGGVVDPGRFDTRPRFRGF